MTLSEFQTQFPEFQSAPPEMVQTFLDRAGEQISSIWGTQADQGQGYLAAHLLAISPNGQFSRLQTNKGETTYKARYDQLVQQVTMFRRVF